MAKTQTASKSEEINDELPKEKMENQIQEIPYIKEMDRKLSHKERILAFLENKGMEGYIPLNDFLKSLYPLPTKNERPAWTDQGKMRKLRQDLRELVQEGKIIFSNMNFDRLGDNYHEGPEQFRRDHNILTLVLEAKHG